MVEFSEIQTKMIGNILLLELSEIKTQMIDRESEICLLDFRNVSDYMQFKRKLCQNQLAQLPTGGCIGSSPRATGHTGT